MKYLKTFFSEVWHNRKKIFKSYLRFLFAIMVIQLIVLAIMLIVVLKMDVNTNDRIFSTLDEIKKADAYAVDELPIPSSLRSEEIEESYCKRISYEGKKYLVYAFVFSDAQTSKDYYEDVVHRVSDRDESYFMSSKKPGGTTYIAYSGTRCYCVKGKGYRATAEFVNWLNEDFAFAVH